MPSTGLDVFDTTLQKTNQILGDIEEELDWQNRRNQAYLALRVVLHALRDRLPIDASVNFAAQLPLLLKGVYFDGWSSESVPIRMNKEEFLGRIQKEFGFEVKEGIEEMTKVVLAKVFNHFDPRERQKVKPSLPPDVASLFGQ